MSRIYFFLILLVHFSAVAQPKIKKVLVDGEGTPLVFLHGATTNMAGLEKPAKDLAGHFKVIRMESFNAQYAEEDRMLPADYSVRMESEGIAYTLDSLKITEPVILVGSSYGGLIALDFALNYPGRVKSLVLLEPIAFGLPSVIKEKPFDYSRIEKITIQLKPTAEITEQQVEQFRCLQFNCDSVNIRTLPQWNSWLQQRNKLRGLSATFEHKIDGRQLTLFKKPVLILTGTRTAPLNKRIDELLQKELTGSRLLYIESGHSIPTQAPQELVKDILEFVNNK